MDMIKMGANLILEGLSQLGKNRINEHGDIWCVIGVSYMVKALNNAPGILIQSIKDGYVKWMGTTSDIDFHIISNDSDLNNDSGLDVVGE